VDNYEGFYADNAGEARFPSKRYLEARKQA
jgi:hypothetical protein